EDGPAEGLEIRPGRPRFLTRRPLDRLSRQPQPGAAAAVRDSRAGGGATCRGERMDCGERRPRIELLAALVSRRQPSLLHLRSRRPSLHLGPAPAPFNAAARRRALPCPSPARAGPLHLV